MPRPTQPAQPTSKHTSMAVAMNLEWEKPVSLPWKKKLRKKERKSFPVLFFLSTSQATTNFEEELAKCPLLNVFPPSLVTVGCLFNLTCKLFSLRTSSVEHGVDDAQTFYVFRSLGSAGVCQLISVVPCAPHVKARLKKVSQVM